MAHPTRRQSSRLLQCFRAVGLICDDLPLAVYALGAETFAAASLGKSFAVYKCDRLTPVLVSPQLPKKILALAVLPPKQLTFTACGREILVWKRVQQLHTLRGHRGDIKQVRCTLCVRITPVRSILTTVCAPLSLNAWLVAPDGRHHALLARRHWLCDDLGPRVIRAD